LPTDSIGPRIANATHHNAHHKAIITVRTRSSHLSDRQKPQNTLGGLPVTAAELVGKFYFRRLEAAAYADTSTDDCQTAISGVFDVGCLFERNVGS
jgi:hypothetical protein